MSKENKDGSDSDQAKKSSDSEEEEPKQGISYKLLKRKLRAAEEKCRESDERIKFLEEENKRLKLQTGNSENPSSSSKDQGPAVPSPCSSSGGSSVLDFVLEKEDPQSGEIKKIELELNKSLRNAGFISSPEILTPEGSPVQQEGDGAKAADPAPSTSASTANIKEEEEQEEEEEKKKKNNNKEDY